MYHGETLRNLQNIVFLRLPTFSNWAMMFFSDGTGVSSTVSPPALVSSDFSVTISFNFSFLDNSFAKLSRPEGSVNSSWMVCSLKKAVVKLPPSIAMSPSILFWFAFFKIFSSTVRSLISLEQKKIQSAVLLQSLFTKYIYVHYSTAHSEEYRVLAAISFIMLYQTVIVFILMSFSDTCTTKQQYEVYST